jgi:CheY-like chemotaxis protein
MALRSGKARILVVEDDVDVRASLAELLGQDGYEVFEAPDGAAARALLAAHDFDLMTLDLRLPVLSGPELLASLPNPPPVIVFSAFSYFDQDAVQERFAGKVSAFLRKPSSPESLLAAVADAVAS